MTTYAGYLYPLPQFYEQELTNSLDDGLERFAGYELQYTPAPLFGTLTHTGTRSDVSHTYSGVKIGNWLTLLFDHILLVPSRLDLGNLLSNEERTIELVNLFDEDRALEGITNNAGPGIVYTDPAYPLTLPPFSTFRISVAVSTNGPPSINGNLFFDFDFDPADVFVPVTGRRIVLFSWRPEAPITETIEWYTDVMSSYLGDEQRASMLLTPRQNFQYEILLTDEAEIARMNNYAFDWAARVWGVPVHHEQRYLNVAANIGDTVLEVDTRFGDFRVGGLVGIIAEDDKTVETFEIDSMTDTQINLTSGLVHAFSVLSRVMPVRTAYADTQIGQDGYPVIAERMSISFSVLDNIDLSDTTDQEMFLGKPVLTDANYSQGNLSKGMYRNVVVIDNKTGRLYQVSPSDRTQLSTRKQWKTNTLEQLWRVRRLVHSFRGSQVSFYMPSFRADFVVVEPIGPGAQSLRSVNVGYTTFVASRSPLNQLRVVLKNGESYVRKILSSDELGDIESINFDGALRPTLINVSEILRAELVWLVRIADDKVTFTHKSGSESIVSAKLISVKQ